MNSQRHTAANDAVGERDQIWQQILESSAAMQEVARKNDWTALNELIESRQQLLDRFFSAPIARHQRKALEQIQSDIKVILQQDANTRKLSERNKAILARGLKNLSKGKQALRHYQ